jgi:hypothetical protein
MIVNFLKSKLFLFLVFVLFTGFIIGYDYAVITSKDHAALTIKAPVTTTDKNEGTADNTQTASGEDYDNSGSE